MKDKLISLALLLPFLMTAAVILGALILPLWREPQAEPVSLGPTPTARIDPPVVYTDPLTVYEPVDGFEYSEAVPLSEGLQYFTQDCCKRYGVSYPLVLGIMEVESTWDPEADSGWAYGLMQIGYINADWLSEQGMDIYTVPGNVEAGIYMIGDLLERYGDPHLALMAYNCGEAGAAELWDEGIATSRYSCDVIAAAGRWYLEFR